jgi:hypothetical protein
MMVNPGLLSDEQAREVAEKFRRQAEEARERLERWEEYLERRQGDAHGKG